MGVIRRGLAVLASTMIVLGGSFTLPSAALAAAVADCSEGPGQVNHWRGQVVGGGAKHGTSGTLPGRTLQMCTNPGAVEVDGTFYWSNIEPASGSFRDIVQVGFGQGRSPTIFGGMYFLSGWGRSTSTAGCSGFSNHDPITIQRGAYDNAQHDYKVYHHNNAWQLLVDSTTKATVAEGSICWSPGHSSWFGETWDKGDRVGGTAASPLPVTLMNYTTTENGDFVWTNLTPGPQCNYDNAPPAAYQCAIASSTSIRIWTESR